MEALLISACLLGMRCRYDGQSRPLDPTALSRLQKAYMLVPVCPEIYGGLTTPRPPAERRGERVVTKEQTDVTVAYHRGAEEALRLATILKCRAALLKERSPSCGKGEIYDGHFCGRLIAGDGLLTEHLIAAGIPVFGESELNRLL